MRTDRKPLVVPAQPTEAGSLTSALRSVLSAGFAGRDVEVACDAGHAAGRLGLHQRTLHRRLRAEGTRFGLELARVRFELAERLLRDTDWPLIDIALALSYAESTSFVRAFKCWTGVTPARFRARVRSSADALTAKNEARRNRGRAADKVGASGAS